MKNCDKCSDCPKEITKHSATGRCRACNMRAVRFMPEKQSTNAEQARRYRSRHLAEITRRQRQKRVLDRRRKLKCDEFNFDLLKFYGDRYHPCKDCPELIEIRSTRCINCHARYSRRLNQMSHYLEMT